MWYTKESTLTVSLPSARAHRRFCELLPQEQRSVEESLQARVSLEQILSLPELKVPAPTSLPLLLLLRSHGHCSPF